MSPFAVPRKSGIFFVVVSPPLLDFELDGTGMILLIIFRFLKCDLRFLTASNNLRAAGLPRPIFSRSVG